MNQDAVLAVALPVTLFLMMLSMGATLALRDFRVLIQQPASVACGIVSQMLLLPLLALALLVALPLPPEIAFGFVVLALAPGGNTSNVFSYLMGGRLALSIALTALVSLLTPITLPLAAGWWLSHRMGVDSAIALPFLPTVGKLVLLTGLPMLLGMCWRWRWPDFCTRHEYALTRVPFFLLLAVIGGIIAQNWDNMPRFLALTALPALVLATAALAAGFGFARVCGRDLLDARTIAIETAIQNGGTAILVTGTLLRNAEMTIAPVMYGILMLVPVLAWLGWQRTQSSAADRKGSKVAASRR